MLVRRTEAAADRVRRARLPGRDRAGRSTSATGACLRHPAAGRAAPGRAAARADLHARHQGRVRATTRTSLRRDGRSAGRRRRCASALERCRSRSTRAAALRRGARHHHRRHQVRVRPRATASCCSIDEVLTPDSSRFWPASYAPGRAQPRFDKQFVRDWLEALRLGQAAARPGAARRRSWRGTRARYIEAYERITGEPFGAYLQRNGVPPHESDGARATPRRHPRSAGRGHRRSLAGLGYPAADVRAGKVFDLEMDAADAEGAPAAPEIAGRCSRNPLIEQFEVEAGGTEGRGRHLPGRVRRPRRHARRRLVGAEPVSLWHARDRPARRRRRDHARRVHLRRLPASGRDRRAVAGDGARARARRCRRPGARHLQRLPGADRGRAAAGRPAAERQPQFRCQDVALAVERASPWLPGCPAGDG